MLTEGMTAILTEEVTMDNAAITVGSGSLPVYATPAMIALIEKSAVELLTGNLPESTTTVGTKLEINHVSATPTGMSVVCKCTLVKIDRRKLVFEVEVADQAGVIGTGTHERFMVEADSFLKKAESKRK
ncbi:MAG: thioesterase family protein [Lachnospiraceae bacterium]|nr:thioesterase family protein [Lachnospiraceae bacterium]